MSSPYHYHRIVGCYTVQIASQGQALFLQLRLMPVRVGHHQLPRPGLPDPESNGLQQLLEVSRPGEIHTRATPDRVQMVVGQPGNNRFTAQIYSPRVGAGQSFNVLVRTQIHDSSIRNRQCLLIGESLIDGNDLAVEQNGFSWELRQQRQGAA